MRTTIKASSKRVGKSCALHRPTLRPTRIYFPYT